ncbi:hypothetical protein D1006_25145 [Burkholderia stabilis]|uniref:Uncharacterized protein n=1 Tax=Burkholderia stabilis TaxID=95485 RepID=A0A4Q2AI49_9BURK|nr:hypothetical protein D1006_25145 [Burkholderia stabilis]
MPRLPRHAAPAFVAIGLIVIGVREPERAVRSRNFRNPLHWLKFLRINIRQHISKDALIDVSVRTHSM